MRQDSHFKRYARSRSGARGLMQLLPSTARSLVKGRRFYGCNNYPTCEFTSWQRPLQEVCPACGGMIVAERGRRAHCTACDWAGPASEAKERETAASPATP